MHLPRKLAGLVGLLCLALVSFAAPASAASVHITSGNGSSAHPYQFMVIKNKANVQVYEITRTYSTRAGDLFTITEQTTMTNKTTEHTLGDRSVTKMYTRFLYGCHSGAGNPERCQKVLFYPQHRFDGKTKLVTPINCTGSMTNACHTSGWVTRYGLQWDIDGGMWSSDYKFPKWQASVSYLHVKINGYWIKRDKAAVMPWVQATLNT